MAESLGGEYLEGDSGESCGLVHINKNFFPETYKKCYDNEFSLRFASKLIQNGEEWLFTSCNCYQYIKYVSDLKLPRMADIQPNTMISVGSIAILQYGDIKHIALVMELHDTYFLVKEANYEMCKTGTRKIYYIDPFLKGFWLPVK